MVQWLGICQPTQGTRGQSLIREDTPCRGATKPICLNYCAWTLEPVSHNGWAHGLQALKPKCPEPALCNERSHSNEKPARTTGLQPPLTATSNRRQQQGSPGVANINQSLMKLKMMMNKKHPFPHWRLFFSYNTNASTFLLLWTT